MSEFFAYLNSPTIVANFQKICGIEAGFDDLERKIQTRSSKKLSNDKNQIKANGSGKKHDSPKALKRKQNGNSKSESKEKSSETASSDIIDEAGEHASYKIHNKFWFYFFHVGAAMGNEVFYCLFFTFWFWNVDGAIARKVAIVWAMYMYLGQATKDIMEMPRPATPPVVKLEKRYIQEYGFPSTHAMVASGLPLSLLVLSYSRYNINLPLSIALVLTFCAWVCASRLYLGMHSLLDVIAGSLYSILILVIVLPFLDRIDHFQLTNPYAPYLLMALGLAVCYFYPSLRQWSTARGDTTIIISVVVGFSIGSRFGYLLGFVEKPDFPPLYDINFPTTLGYMLLILRTFIGLVMLVLTRHLNKEFLLRFLCWWHKLNPKDPEAKRQKKIELPYYYVTYLMIGINVAFTSPFVFRYFGIARDYTYTEL